MLSVNCTAFLASLIIEKEKVMNVKKEIIEQWYKDEKEGFNGWDFSYLSGRWEHENTPWNYEDIISKHLELNHILLDMGTGGGEFLLSLNHPYENSYVTEAWEPNIELCMKKLKPLGITVVPVEDDDCYPATSLLPFENDTFDIIINRHESYNTSEVKRVLKPNGIFITQQVGGMNNNNLSKRLIKGFVAPHPDITLKNALNNLYKMNFEINVQNEFYPKIKFFDVGAITFFAKVIEWEFPGFNLNQCLEELTEIHKQILVDGYYESEEHRFIIVAKNKKA